VSLSPQPHPVPLRPALPGYTARALRLDDLPAVLALLDRDAERWTGEPYFPAADYALEWQEPGFDLDLDTVLLLDGARRAAGLAEVHAAAPFTRAVCWVRVDPDHEGRGLGSHLTQWAVRRAAERAENGPPGERALAICETVSANRAAAALLAAHGFAPLRTFIRMRIALDEPPPPPAWPEGIAVRTMAPGADDLPLYLAIQDAFADHWDHVAAPPEEGLAEWRHALLASPAFDPSLVFLATAGDEPGEIAGFAVCTPPERPGGAGFVLSLGVRRLWRRRGLARALLLHAFGVLHERGVCAAALNVDADSLTGATRLYESVGMAVHFRNDLYALELRADGPTA
jgi:mycothiol synthase